MKFTHLAAFVIAPASIDLSNISATMKLTAALKVCKNTILVLIYKTVIPITVKRTKGSLTWSFALPDMEFR